jgi:hypothetical protein
MDVAHTPMMSRPVLRRSKAVNQGSRHSIADSLSALSLLDDTSLPVQDLAATLRQPIDTPTPESPEPPNGIWEKASAPRKSSHRSSFPSSQENIVRDVIPCSSSHGWRCSIPKPAPPRPTKKARYYSFALSDEDKHSLAVGEKNHNLKDWKPMDLLHYHDARAELVPYCDNRVEILTALAEDKRRSEQFLLRFADTPLFKDRNSQAATDRNVRQSLGMPAVRLDPPHIEKIATYHEKQAYQHPSLERSTTQSMVDLRIPSSPGPMPPSRPSAFVERQFSFSREGHLNLPVHSRRASFDNHLANQHARHISVQSRNSSLSTANSSGLQSPLVYEYKRNVTFDSFLVPHVSGKGETVRDTKYAAENKGKKPDGSSEASRMKRLSKMPSVPLMRKRPTKMSSRVASDV